MEADELSGSVSVHPPGHLGAADVLLHFGLEALGALGLRCVVGWCDHAAHRVLAWAAFGLLTSWVTVGAVG